MRRKNVSSKKMKMRLIETILILICLVIAVTLILVNKLSIPEEEIIEVASDFGIRDETIAESWDTNTISTYIVDTSMTDDDGNEVTIYVPIPVGYVASEAEGETTVKERIGNI